MKTIILCRVCGGKSNVTKTGLAKCKRCGSWNTKINLGVLNELDSGQPITNDHQPQRR
jgi:predicted ATP-dependent serine protease